VTHHLVEDWKLGDVLGSQAGYVLRLHGVSEGSPGSAVRLPRLPQVHRHPHVHGNHLQNKHTNEYDIGTQSVSTHGGTA